MEPLYAFMLESIIPSKIWAKNADMAIKSPFNANMALRDIYQKKIHE